MCISVYSTSHPKFTIQIQDTEHISGQKCHFYSSGTYYKMILSVWSNWDTYFLKEKEQRMTKCPKILPKPKVLILWPQDLASYDQIFVADYQ